MFSIRRRKTSSALDFANFQLFDLLGKGPAKESTSLDPLLKKLTQWTEERRRISESSLDRMRHFAAPNSPQEQTMHAICIRAQRQVDETRWKAIESAAARDLAIIDGIRTALPKPR